MRRLLAVDTRRSLVAERAAVPDVAAVPAWREAVGVAASLVKYRLVALVLLTMLGAAEIAAHGEPPVGALALVLVGGALAAGGAAALNHYFDRDIDVLMLRTRGRPVPSGALSARGALLVGVALLGAAAAPSILASPLAAVWVGLAAFTYVVIYTCWLKRRTPAAVVVGGLTGSWAVLAGWSAVRPEVTPLALVLAAVVFTWTPAHFWAFAVANADDYGRAGVPTLANVAGLPAAARRAWWYALVTVVLALAPAVLAGPGGLHGVFYGVVAAVAGGVWLWWLWRFLRRPVAGAAWAAFHASNAYLGAVFLALFLAARR